jgi:hypothetical protein
VRRTLQENTGLPSLLRKLDALRGPDREEQLHAALGVAPGQQSFDLTVGQGSASVASARGYSPQEMTMLRALAQAVEGAVRSGKEEELGLDWEGLSA